MASRRILNRSAHSSPDTSDEVPLPEASGPTLLRRSRTLPQAWLFSRFLGMLILSSIFIYSCGTTKKSSRDAGTEDASDEMTDAADESAAEVSREFIALLNTNRSSLNDVYSTQKSEMPDLFLQNDSLARDIGDPNQGYRIQILSTRNVSEADSVASGFRFWAVENIKDYVPETYVLYRQPYYKVHVGNFQFQDKAMQLNTLVKNEYPDAWIVPDEVEADLVPPDTLMLGDEKEKKTE
jgi:hypothetical protein